MVSEIHKKVSRLSPLLTLIDNTLSRSCGTHLTEEDITLLTDDLALLAVMQRTAFQSIRQEREQTPRLNADFHEVP